MSNVIARRYARALIEIGREAGNLDAMVQQFSEWAVAYEGNSDLRNALDNPLVALDAKRAILSDMATQMGIDVVTKNTILLLGDRRRLRLLPGIARMLREMNDARKGIVRADVITAVRLADTYYTRLQLQLERMTGKRVVLETREDPAIIGGVIARIGDTVIDGSIRTRLEEMKNTLLSQPLVPSSVGTPN